jgi:hypothetical protein
VPYDRLFDSQQTITSVRIQSILDGAVAISAQIGTSNQDNTASLVREPINNTYSLSSFIGGKFDPRRSDFQGTWPRSVEDITPDTFTNSVRSDLYEVRPLGYVDPHTGLTNGSAAYLGYFEFKPDGSMTFTRANASTPPGPPPPPKLSIARSGTISTISFATTNGATYTLYYTSANGLGQPAANWPSSPNTITGDGTTKSFVDSSADSTRYYRVSAR